MAKTKAKAGVSTERKASMNIAKAQKIVNDSRYGSELKKEARRVLKEAKKAGKLEPKKKVSKKKTAKLKTVKSKRRGKPTSKKKKTTTKKKPAKKLRRAKKSVKSSKPKPKSETAQTGAKIKFYDVKSKKYVKIPRDDCRVKRNRTPRGGDRLIGSYKGRELHTFVKKGFKL